MDVMLSSAECHQVITSWRYLHSERPDLVEALKDDSSLDAWGIRAVND